MRTLLGAFIGYITMTVVVITGNSLAGHFLHLDSRSSPVPSAAVAIFFAFVAANVGGFVATAIGREPHLHPALALIALSIAMLALTFFKAPVPQPLWYLVSVLAVMIVGVLLGARLRIRSQALSARSKDTVE